MNAFGAVTPGMVVDLLMQAFTGSSLPTPAQIEERVDAFLTGPFAGLNAHRAEILEEVLRRLEVRIGSASTLVDNTDHVEWLRHIDRQGWRFWPRLDEYLRREDRLPPAVLLELARSTDQALERLESPERSGRWDRRGLVVGHVQSGKTTHYTALAAKALDAGYQIVIILAGVHNSLRSQTHERIDRYLIGRDSAALLEAARTGSTIGLELIGVEREDQRLGRPRLQTGITTLTTSADDGDFRTHVANQVGFQVSAGSRLVMVVKKNATILRNLIRWLNAQTPEGVRIPAPTLVIDDEADHASVNTAGDPDADPTTINRLIRELLISFQRVGLVGYTATPFANIFIAADDVHDKYGPDLFPRSFIVNLKAPSDYIGPSLVFGHPGDDSVGIAEQLPLPTHVKVTDAGPWIPDRHRTTHQPGALPVSLREAIRLFVMICAARGCRGDVEAHNSMLVHATRFVNVQGRVAEQIEDELSALRNVIGSGSRTDVARIRNQMDEIWQQRVVEPHPDFAARLGERCPALPGWSEVWEGVSPALERLSVLKINGGSADALAYSRANRGLYVIAIGGDKLSRGLTLEGLSISYFLRTSSMFDTLMQMGRWFGYRPRYADLCRVYTTPLLYSAFREIALSMEELRSDLDYMAAIKKTPVEFGLRVRTPPDGLLITAANKIRRGEEVEVRFAGDLKQALEVERTGSRGEENRRAVHRLIEPLQGGDRLVRGKVSPHLLWRGVPADAVVEFLESYEALATPSFHARCDPLRRFIREQVRRGGLIDWTVVVVSKAETKTPTARIRDVDLRLVKRGRVADTSEDRFKTQAVVGLAEESLDLTEEEHAAALVDTPPPSGGGPARNPSREALRAHRPRSRGALLIYPVHDEKDDDPNNFIPLIAVSFPADESARSLSYTVNEVWRAQHGLGGDVDDNGQPA
jgi:Z1 domain-containing protein